MKKLRIDNPSLIERLSKSFVGDDQENTSYPYRSGSNLVKFFNELGYDDVYGAGFPTRWRYAEERIKDLVKKKRFDEFLIKSISIEELIRFDIDGSIEELHNILIDELNNYIFNYTDFKIVTINSVAVLRKIEPLDRIGGGYFANVYLLEESRNKYAVKKLKEEFTNNREYVHRFKREYEMMNDLNDCEYTITVYEYNEDDYSFKMEYAEYTLKEYIEDNFHVMNDSWKEDLCDNIIKGLIKLHETTIHRDLSYNNILINNNRPKLADFGLGKNLDKLYSYKTVSEKQVGTPLFTDPRQHHNIKNANEQTDVYSLGKIIDYIFSGSIISEEHKYSSLVAIATHRNLEKRYKNAKELYQSFIAIKNSNFSFNPVIELENMFKEENISTEKMYSYLTRKNAGNILLELILRNRGYGRECLEIFSVQFSHEFDELLSKLYNELKETKLNYSEYDSFGYISMDLLKELGSSNPITSDILASIINYCADDINRFNIQRLIENNKNDKKIPYIIREKWIK